MKQKISFYIMHGKSLLLLALVVSPLCLLAQINTQLDQKLSKLVALRNNGEYEIADSVARTVLNDAQRAKYVKGEVNALIEISICTADENEIPVVLQRALQLSKSNGLQKEKARCYLELGSYNKNIKNELQSALVYYDSALYIRKQIIDNPGVASLYNLLSDVHLKLYQWEDARNCSQMSISLYSRLPDEKLNLAKAYNNYANVLEAREVTIDSAIICNKKSLEILNEIGSADTILLIDVHYGIAKRYLEKKNYTEANVYFQKCLELAEKSDDAEAKGMSLEGLGVVAMRNKDEINAAKYLNAAKNIYIETKDTNGLVNLFNSLGDFYRSSEDFERSQVNYDSALHFLNGRVMPGGELREIITQNIKINKEMISRKEQEIAAERWRLFLYVAAMLILVLIAYHYYAQAKTRGENIALKERVWLEKEQAVKAQDQLNKTNLELIRTKEENIKNAEEVLRLKSLHHIAIKGHLSTILAHLISGSFDTSKFKAMIEESIRMLREDLPEPTELGVFVKEMHSAANLNAQMDVELKKFLDDSIGYKITGKIRQNLSTIIELAFVNIRLHAKCSHASLTFEEDGNYLNVVIEDNGIGFDLANTRKGAIGIKDIEAKAKEMNAACDIITSPGNGTIIRVRIPSPYQF